MFQNQPGADFDDIKEPTGNNQQPPAAPPNVDDPLADETEKRRYQYWQSKHDKLRQEYEQLRGQVQPQATSQSAPQRIEKPAKPQKPSNYDPNEAYQPGTQSFQYRVQMDEYTERYQDWLEHQTSSLEQQQQQYLQQVEAQQRLEATKQEVMYEHGLKADEAEDFIRMMTDPSMMSLENLVKVYRAMKVPSAPPQQQPQPPQYPPSRFLDRGQNPAPPPAGVIGGGQGQQLPDDREGFIMGLRSRAR